MAAGTHFYTSTGHAMADGLINATICQEGFFNTSVRLRSIFVRGYYTNYSTSVKPVIYDSNTGVKLAEGTLTNRTLPEGSELVFSGSGVVLEANKNYKIGVYSSGSEYIAHSAYFPDAHSSTTPGFTFTPGTYYYVSNSDINPYNALGNRELMLGLSADLLNVAPSVSSAFPSQEARDPRNPIIFSWTYSDADSNPQTGYNIQYRERGSEGTWTLVQATGAAPSHTFAANTFTLGKEYEYQIKVADGVAGYGQWSPLQWFMAGTDIWKYTPEVTSSTQSGTLPKEFFTHTFDAGLDGWGVNNFFGTYVDPSIARTTTRPKSGTHSLEVTWPTGAQSRTVSGEILGFVPGAWYEYAADIYVPTGSPNVTLDPFLQTGATNVTVAEKDQWVRKIITFRAGTPNIFFGVNTAQASTAGQKCWIDNATVSQVSPSAGDYIVQVRTADAEGFGPWSGGTEFKVASPPNKPTNINLNPTRVGGNINVTWTYSDPENNPQTKYQIQYRKVT